MMYVKIIIWSSLFIIVSQFLPYLYQYFKNNYKENIECTWYHDETIISNYSVEYKNGQPVALYGPPDPFNTIPGENTILLGKKISESNETKEGLCSFSICVSANDSNNMYFYG